MSDPNGVAVSVIVPVYNGERYLRECLDSVLQQQLEAWQMICIDDGSTDQSARILAEYAEKDDHIQIITQANRGLSASRNAGIQAAAGEYLQFLDCDDKLAPGALGTLCEQARRQKLDVLYYDGDTFFDEGMDDDGQFAVYKQLYTAKVNIPEPVTGLQMFRMLYEAKSYRASACLQIIRREYLNQTGVLFDEGILYEDNIFTLKTMTQAPRAGYCHRAFYQRRMHPNSIVTSKKDYWHLRSYVVAYVEISQYVLQNHLPQDVMPGVMAQLHSLLGHAAAIYKTMTFEQKQQVLNDYPESSLVNMLAMMGKLCAPVSQRESAKGGKGIQWLNKASYKLRRGMYLCRMEGTRYTIKRCVQKMGEKIGYIPSWRALVIRCMPHRDGRRPLVSVVLPVYNGHEYLERTIDSLSAQTMKNAEFIFVDDGSTDDSVDLLEEAAARDSRFRILRQEKANAGAARNRGLQEAQGEYVVFLDSDDTFDPHLLTHAYDRAKRFDAQVVIYDADAIRLPQHEKIKPYWMRQTQRLPKGVFSGKDAPEYLFQVLNPWTKLYQREYIQREGFQYQSQFSANDAYFTIMALACAQRMVTLPEVLVHYHIGYSGNIQSLKSREPLNTYRAFFEAKKDLQARGLLSAFRVPLAVKAAESMLRELDTLGTDESKKQLYEVLHQGGLEELDFLLIQNHSLAQKQLGARLERCQRILNCSWEEFCETEYASR